LKDLYFVPLLPDEFHELLSEYETYVEWSMKSMTVTQKEVTERVLKRLHEADATHVCLDEVDLIMQGKQLKQFTRDDVARIAASTVTSLLEQVNLQQIVQGIAVFSVGKEVYIVDVVMRDLVADSTWGVSITIPSIEDETDEWSKEFPITSLTREDLISFGFSEAVVETLTDDDLQEIASAMEDVYCDHGYWEDLELCTKRILKRKEDDAGLEHDVQTRGDEDGLT
jgi:hypothetical protein